jgi:hypothetical protein
LKFDNPGYNILGITPPGQRRPVLCVGKLHTLILEICKQGSDTVACNREIKFLGIYHLTATQPHFPFIGFKNIAFMTYFDKHACSFPFTITIEEEPIDTKCQDKKNNN